VDRPEVVPVRHGATEWSVSGRHTGRTDLPLLPQGEDEARRIAPLLAGRPFAAVLVSPLQRARRTCELAGFADHPGLVVDGDLAEWDYGELEGLTTPEIRERWPGWTIWDGPVPGGETAAQVAARADRVVARMREADGDVLAFSHGHLLRVLAARWCGADPGMGRLLPLATGTLGTLGWEHEWGAIRTWNCGG
jgi:broad specificity phosphatase PhoE